MLAATEPAASWPLLVAGVALGLLAVWAGVRCWTGRWPGPFGPRPLYQSFYGGAHLGVPVGLWAVLLAGGEVVRAGLGLDRDGPFFTAVSVVSSVIGAAALVYALAYYWTGVPPRLRPPHQRHQRAVGEGRVRRRVSRLRYDR